jgi:hypothetical protein
MQPLLHIDLTTRSIDEIKVPREWEVDFIGGASLAARILYDKLIPAISEWTSFWYRWSSRGSFCGLCPFSCHPPVGRI